MRGIGSIKAPPARIGSLRPMSGALPACHMNKAHWLTLLPDTLPAQALTSFVEDSFFLTRT